MFAIAVRCRISFFLATNCCRYLLRISLRLIYCVISCICENNIITQNLPFLSYHPHKITLFFLHTWLNRCNYALKNGSQRGPTTLNWYVEIMYIENFFYPSWKVPIFELCRCSRVCAISPVISCVIRHMRILFETRCIFTILHFSHGILFVTCFLRHIWASLLWSSSSI